MHASSIGSVIAGLKKAQQVEWLDVPPDAVGLGENALRGLLPRESVSKFCDLALLTLIYPFNVTTGKRLKSSKMSSIT